MHLLPAEIEPAPAELVGQTLRMRIYVGADHRARVVGWERELDEVVALTSGLLHGGTDIQLELSESVGWERSGGPLDNTLASLVAQDPGNDVDIVVGLVDATDDATASFSALVASERAARHVVVRGFHWQAESAALGADGESLSEAAKDSLLVRRRRHKQSVLLAHGIATLFGEEAALGAEFRLETASMERDAGARLKAAIPLELAERAAAAAARQKPAVEEGRLRRIDTENLAQVHLLLDAKKPGVAWEILEPLLELYPEHASIADAGCLVAEARDGSDMIGRCNTAVQLGSKTPRVFLALASKLGGSQPEQGAAHLRTVEALLEPTAKEWRDVALSYQKLSLASSAMRAAANAKEVDKVVKWARETKSRYGVHVGVPLNEEGRYLLALQTALKEVYAGNFPKSTAASKALSRNYPKSIGASLIRCEIAMHKRNYEAAVSSCKEVLAKQPENSWARYLQGVAFARQKRTATAIGLLIEAIERDESLEAAYKALGQLYRKSRDARLSALKKSYKRIFGKAL